MAHFWDSSCFAAARRFRAVPHQLVDDLLLHTPVGQCCTEAVAEDMQARGTLHFEIRSAWSK
jgi:hypothetical protein